MTLQEFLRQELKRRQISVRELARLLGESHWARTARVVRGDTMRPEWDFLEKLSASLAVDLELLVALVSPDLAQRSRLSTEARLIAHQFDVLPEEFKAIVRRAILGMNTNGGDDNLPLLRETDKILKK